VPFLNFWPGIFPENLEQKKKCEKKGVVLALSEKHKSQNSSVFALFFLENAKLREILEQKCHFSDKKMTNFSYGILEEKRTFL
jgi:hypothetical protein